MRALRSTNILAAFLAAAGFAAAPEASAAPKPIGRSVTVAAPVKFDISPPLRDIKPIQDVSGKGSAPANPPIQKSGRALGPGVPGPDGALQQRPGATTMPDPLANFEGINNIWGYLPPDTTGDVGPNHFVEWVNVGFAVYDKATGTKIYPASGFADGNTLWSGFSTPCSSSNDGDPQVNYDHLADRWVMSQFALPNYPSGPFYQCFAISVNGDPTGSWYRYQYVVSNTKMNDYPKVGVWPDGYYYTVNQFVGNNWGGLGVAVYEREKMIAGDPAARQVYIDTGAVTTNYGGALPADLDGMAPPPGTPGYVMEWDDSSWIGDPTDTIRIWEFHVDWANPANSTFGLNSSFDASYKIPTADATVLCSGNRACIPQPGTSAKLDAIGDRLMQRLQYRIVNGVPRLTTNMTVDAGGSRAGVRWYQLENPGTGWAMKDQGTFAGDAGDTEHRWMGGAALDIQGNMAVGYSVSSGTVYPSIRYNGRLAGDPAGTLGTEKTLVAGAGSQTSTSNRWGDYSAMLVDPTDECTFWYTQQYYGSTSGANWQTRIGSFKFPGCVAGPSGVIQGYVKTTAGGTGIAGARVQVGASISTTTDATGYYHLTVPVDTYDVTASKFGYAPATATGQAVTDGGTTTVADLLLTPVGTYAVDGFVTAADHAWPLWAKVDVYQGTTLVETVYTSPWNGYYEIPALPNGFAYDFKVHSMYDGYLDETRTVTLSSSDQVQSFTLLAASGNPAYTCYLQGGINENFDAAFPPLGWTVKNNGTVANNVWKRNDTWGRANETGGTGTAAAADSDKAGSGSGPFDTELWSPPIKMPAAARNLKFKQSYRQYTGETGTLDVSTNGGNSWTNLKTFTVTSTAEQTVDMTAYAGQTIILRWKFVSPSYAYYWQVDDVRTETIPPAPPAPTSVWTQNWDSVTAPALPAGWTVATVSGSPTWLLVTSLTNPTIATGHTAPNFFRFNSYSVSTGTARIAKTTNDDLSSGTGYLRFWMYHDTAYTSADRVNAQVSTDGGTTWQTVGSAVNRYDGSTGWKQHEIALTGFTGSAATVRVGLLATSAYGSNVAVDEFELLLGASVPPAVVDNPTLLCETVPGSLVAGFVTDANSAAGITGAQVVRDLGGLATTMAATGDQPAGFYYMFSPAPGANAPNGPSTRTFTASKAGYGPVQKSLNLVPDTVNRIDFALPAASLSLGAWPFVVDGRLTPDGLPAWDKTQDFSILNTGGLPANVKLTVAPIATTWRKKFPTAAPMAPPSSPVKFSTGRAHKKGTPSGAKKFPGLAGSLAGVTAFGVEVYPGTTLHSWADASVPGTWSNVGSAATYFAGDFLNGDFSKLYAINYDTNAFVSINTATAAATTLGTATPGSGESWSGLAGAPSGVLYGSATTCSASTLYTINPADGHPTAIGPITNGACIIDIAVNAAGELYGVEITGANLVKIDPATGAGTIVGALGATPNYAQGLDFDEDSGTLYWAAYTTSGELRTIDTATGASYLIGAFPGGAEVDSYAIATGGASSLPWLTLTPMEGAVPAASQLDIHAEFFPEGVKPAHFGLFRAVIGSTNDTPQDLPDIPVYFTKAFWDVPRTHWADAHIHALAGARITRGCGGGNFCPESQISRSQMAITIVRAMYGPDYVPPPAVGVFSDVVISDSDTTADYIEQLYNDGVVNGCDTNPLRYCPTDMVNRAQMAKFLSLAFELPILPATGYFTDVVGIHSWAAPYAEALFTAGITLGCGDHIYCPGSYITRAELAVMLVRGLGLPMYQHPPAP